MLHHVTLLTLRPDAPAEQVATILEHLAPLPALIDTLRSYDVRADLGINPDNAHVCVRADFDDTDGYLVYRDHPAHRHVIDTHIAPYLQGRSTVQIDGGG